MTSRERKYSVCIRLDVGIEIIPPFCFISSGDYEIFGMKPPISNGPLLTRSILSTQHLKLLALCLWKTAYPPPICSIHRQEMPTFLWLLSKIRSPNEFQTIGCWQPRFTTFNIDSTSTLVVPQPRTEFLTIYTYADRRLTFQTYATPHPSPYVREHTYIYSHTYMYACFSLPFSHANTTKTFSLIQPNFNPTPSTPLPPAATLL